VLFWLAFFLVCVKPLGEKLTLPIVGPAEVLLISALVKLRALLKRKNHVFGLLPYKPTSHNSSKPDVSSNIAVEV